VKTISIAIFLAGFPALAVATETTIPVPAAEPAPPAWPRYGATIAKDQVNLRTEPSLKGKLAPSRAPKGTAISVQRASDPKWLEILDPDEYRGFFVREDMVTLGAEEKEETQQRQ
jgi:hypothetical protein